jgi:hypothetical protein
LNNEIFIKYLFELFKMPSCLSDDRHVWRDNRRIQTHALLHGIPTRFPIAQPLILQHVAACIRDLNAEVLIKILKIRFS